MSWASKTKATAVEESTSLPVVRNPTDRVWSDEQCAIFTHVCDALATPLVVRARAGTGKTTTIVEAIHRLTAQHPERRILVCAFNKRIADELVLRFDGLSGVDVKTLHALGFSLVKRWWGRVKIAQRSERADGLTNRVCRSAPESIKKLVSKLHTKGREITPHATTGAQLLPLAEMFECDPDDYWASQGYGLEFICEHAAQAMALAAEETDTIDFADMIFLPVRNHWTHPEYDDVFVDEGQDMAMAQLEIAEGMCRQRLIIVGDDRQAIYKFRGADVDSLDRLKRKLHATELGLKTTYRCGKAIVTVAQSWVPDIEAGAHNGDGCISTLPRENLTATVSMGDFVLSRLNAPLVSCAMALLRSGKRTRIAGRDIGQGLKTLVWKFAKGSSGVPQFLSRLAAWEQQQLTRALRLKWRDRAAQVADQAETLRHLAMDARSINEIEDRIDALFTDDGLGDANMITCSSVHRAKGLEANRVFVLRETLKDIPGEEQNICYVAVTRAKHELVWVV